MGMRSSTIAALSFDAPAWDFGNRTGTEKHPAAGSWERPPAMNCPLL
jgi:hypothetical protein